MSSEMEVSVQPRSIFTREDSELLSIEALKFIMAHLEGKKEPNGTKWKPYSNSYKKRLTRLGEPTNVDFFRSGKFLSSLKRRAARRKFTVGIRGKAGQDPGYIAAHELRPFIGLSLKELDKIITTCVSLTMKRWKETTKMTAMVTAGALTNRNLAVNRGSDGSAVREAGGIEGEVGLQEVAELDSVE